jgi:hypothetical protein
LPALQRFRTSRHRRLALTSFSLLLCAAIAFTAGCRNKREDPTPTAKKVKPAPGAERWEGAALELPASAPMVLVVRSRAILSGIGSLYEWMISEPAMLGEGDVGIVRARELVNLREGLKQEFGMDVLSFEDWSRYGVDLDQPVHAGLYPLADSGKAFVKLVEDELVERLSIEDRAQMMASLESYTGGNEKILGLYSELSKKGRGAEANAGGRLVFSLSDEARALDTIDRMMSAMETTRSRPSTASTFKRIYFIDRKEDIPVMGVRTERGYLLVDIVYVPRLDSTEEGARRAEATARIEEAVARSSRGFPRAPRPLDEPALALSLDQEGFSSISRYSGYQAALSRSLNSAASERDSELLLQLTDAIRGEYAWDVGTKGLSGFAYELHLGGERDGQKRLLGAHMTLFGEHGLELPPNTREGTDLALESRSIGTSFDPMIFTEARWKQWLGVEHPDRILEAFDYDPDGIASAWTYLLALPRNVALLAANFEEMLKAEAPIDVIPLYAHRDKIERIDLVLPGLSLSNFYAKPHVLGLVRLKPEVAPIDRDVVSAALRDTLYLMLDNDDLEIFTPEETAPLAEGDAEETPEAVEEEAEHDYAKPLAPNKVGAMSPSSASKLHGMTYFYQRDGETPWILFGYGMSAEEFDAEIANVRKRQKGTSERIDAPAARLRAEPVGLVQLTAKYAPKDEFGGFDLGILAQRIGPLLLSVESGASQQRAIRYGFDLMNPPELD